MSIKKPWGNYVATKPAGIWKGTHERTGEVAFFYYHATGRSRPYPTAREAAAARDEGRQAPKIDPKAPMTFGQFVTERYLPSKGGRASTAKDRAKIAKRIERIRPQFLELDLADITLVELNLLAGAHHHAPGTVNSTTRFVGQVMRYAVADGRITAWTVKRKAEDVERVRPPMIGQVRSMLAALDRDRTSRHYKVPVLIDSMTGLRAAELRGLTVSCLPALRFNVRASQWYLDEDPEWRVYVRHQIDNDGRLAPTKSKAGRRWVPLGADGYDAIVAHLNEYGVGPTVPALVGGGTETLVFTGRRTKQASPWLSRMGFLNAIRVAAHTAGFECNAHQLRHFYATQCARAGVKPKELQRRMGHASFAITMDLYADFYEDDDDDPAEGLLSGLVHQPSTSTSAAPASYRSLSVDHGH